MKLMMAIEKRFNYFIPIVFFCALLLPSFANANVIIGPPPPQNVLLVTSGGGSNAIYEDLPAALQCIGATVTIITISGTCGLQNALTAAGLTLSQFDQVWDVRWPGDTCDAVNGPATTPGTDQYLYAQYLANRGSLFFLYEYAGFNTRYYSV